MQKIEQNYLVNHFLFYIFEPDNNMNKIRIKA